MKLSSKAIILLMLAGVPMAGMAQRKPTPKLLLTVAQDGSGDYTTIQEAVDAVRDYTPVPITIYVKNGVYHEKLIIPTWKCDIIMRGENVDSTIITYGDYASMMMTMPNGSETKMGTFRSHTVLAAGNRLTFDNLTIENTAGRVGQAVALHTDGDKIVVKNCRLKGNQDTLFTGNENASVYFVDTYIEGTTDFIFGPATCWFQNCTLNSLADSYVTAASTQSHSRYGYVFKDCHLTAADDVHKVYLGRPWRENAAVVFINCNMDSHIRPEGWHNWGSVENESTARYAEYHNYGDGAKTDGRVTWSHQLTDSEAAEYTIEKVFGETDWIK
jgi:pectin methylesterase-like acyl-CoA thioesterase